MKQEMKIRKSLNPKKKFDAIFDDGEVVSFGAAGYTDYTLGASETQRDRYIARHRVAEQWNDPRSPGALSRYILWGDSRSIQQNLKSYRKRFNL